MSETVHNLEGEQGVLGCLLWEGGDAFHDAVAAGLKAEWFYDLRNGAVFRAVSSLEAGGTPSSISTVRSRLGDGLEAAGGLAYLMQLADATSSPANLHFYLDQCRSALLRRKAGAIAAEAADMAGGDAEGEDVLRRMAERATEAMDSVTQRDSDHGNELASQFTDSLEKRKALVDSGQRSGLRTGLRRLDSMTDGLQFGEQFIIGARPSAGKTAIGLTIAAEIAIRQNVPTLIVSCEMSTTSLVTRLCSVCTGVSLSALRYGSYNQGELQQVVTFNARLAEAPLYIFNAISGITGSEVAAVMRQHARRHGVRFVLVDYLQKVKPDKRSEKRTYEVAEVSGALRSAAVASNVALITLAQVNRESEQGKEPRMPRLCDLADSGQIERDADTVALIHRDKNNNSEAKLFLAKQRDGETGLIDLHFNGPLTRFEDHDNDNPSL